MFKRPIPDPGIDEAIAKVHLDMNGYSAYTDQYAQMVKQLVKLHKLKATQTPQRISPDTWLTVGAHIVGIAVIVGHERTNVVTSRALSFIKKLL